MARVADHVYDHILAVCRDASTARTAAVAALARSPRSVAAALAHCRSFAVGAAGLVRDGGRPAGSTVPDGLLELAWLLAATRPVDERSTVDLAVRHGLDRAALGRALTLTPTAAGAATDAVLDAWEHDLRPALVAFLGPAECTGLRDVLADAGLADPTPAAFGEARERGEPAEGTAGGEEDGDTRAGAEPAEPAGRVVEPTLDTLLAVAPAVAAHVERCDVCPDRVRAMASLRSLLSQVPIAVAPPSLQPAGGRRRRSPVVAESDIAGDDIAGDGIDRSRRRRRVVATAAAVAVLVVAGAVTVAALGRGGDDQVAVLTRVPARNALAAVPDEIHPGQVFLLESTGDHVVRWQVRAPVPWLRVAPASGVLAPRHTSEIQVHLDDSAPEGELRADLAVSADDGSTVLVHLRGSVEHPPTVAATIDGCTVTAQVEDESEVASVELRWSPPSDGEEGRAMASGTSGYRAAVPSSATSWWVTAVDGRGNRARSAERALAPC